MVLTRAISLRRPRILFKLKFQLNMGQTESLKKIRGLRKEIARVKTILGERERSTAGGQKK